MKSGFSWGWTFKIITNCFSVCVCMCMYVHVLLCGGESRDWRRVSSSMAVYLILLGSLSYWTRNAPVYLDLVGPGILLSLLPNCEIKAQITTAGFCVWFWLFCFLTVGAGTGDWTQSSCSLTEQSLYWLSPPWSHYQNFNDYSISTH